jgi:hypothetical protein
MVKKKKLVFGLARKEWHDMHEKCKREIIPEPNPDTSDESFLGGMVAFLKGSGGEQVSRNFSRLIPILDRI